MFKTTKVVGTIARMWADNVSSKFLDSLVKLAIYEQFKLKSGKYIHYTKASVSWHELGRNEIVDNAMGDWLFMLDTDHVFAPDLLERLFRLKRKVKAQIINGSYQYKAPPHNPVANVWRNAGDGKLSVIPITNWDRNAQIIQIGSCGSGCLLVDRPVLTRMMKELNANPFTIIPGLSEDYSFCYRAKQLGIPVWWAPHVECHHVIPTVLSLRDYRGEGEFQKIEAGMVK